MNNVIQNGGYCVYVHTSPSGKMYVGQTGREPKKRWQNGDGYLHKNRNRDEYQQPAFARAILKYGWDNFEHEIIASNLTKEEANNFEQLLIEKLNTTNPTYGYNCTKGGEGCSASKESKRKMSESHKGIRHTEETKKKISESLQGENCYIYGKHLSEETKKKLSESHKGKTLSDEQKRKIGEAIKGVKHPFYGKQHTEETKIKMSASHKGLLVGINNPNSRKVVQYDLNENLIKIWDCMSDASKELGISNQSIYNCCKGFSKRAGGFVWRYYDNIEEMTQKNTKNKKNKAR